MPSTNPPSNPNELSPEKADLQPSPAASQKKKRGKKEIRTFQRTDTGNAEMLAARYGETVRFDHLQKRWLIWRSHWWEPDRGGTIQQFAKNVARLRLKNASNIKDVDECKKEIAWALLSESCQKRDAMIKLAQSEDPISSHGENWDTDPLLLGVRNGVIDLSTGVLRDGKPEDQITKHAPVSFDPTARCSLWERVIREIFAGDPAMVDYIHRAFGYSLTGSTQEECLFLLYGDGRNGKGTLVYVISKMLGGDYAGTADFSTFIHTKGDTSRPREDVAQMKGKRFISSQEPKRRAALAESLVKWLTGGDRLRARKLYENSSEFDPTHKIWLAVNRKPRIYGTDEGIWSRIKPIPFTVYFDEQRRDRTLKRKLLQELPGILAWAVRGCLEWQRRGLGDVPTAVREATESYRQQSDPLREFLEECCEVRPGATVPVGDLWKAYQEWGKATEESDPVDYSEFAENLENRGYERDRLGHGGTRSWKGITLLPMVEDTPGKDAVSKPKCIDEAIIK